MNAEQRAELLEQLERDRAALLADIERRRPDESDVFAFDDWVRERAAVVPLTRQNDAEALMHRTTDNNVPAATASGSEEERLSDALLEAGGYAIAELRREWRRELEDIQARAKAVAPLESEVAALRVRVSVLEGQLAVVLAVIGGTGSKSVSEVTALPKRGPAHVA